MGRAPVSRQKYRYRATECGIQCLKAGGTHLGLPKLVLVPQLGTKHCRSRRRGSSPPHQDSAQHITIHGIMREQINR